jgi:3-dehydroquinate synthase
LRRPGKPQIEIAATKNKKLMLKTRTLISSSSAASGRSESRRSDKAPLWDSRNISTPGTSAISEIVRDIRVTFRHQVFFTHNAFSPANPLLRRLLGGSKARQPQKVLVVLDNGLARVKTRLSEQIVVYFAAQASILQLVCSPIRVEGGERTKSSSRCLTKLLVCMHRHNLDRHSYVLAIGGGALLDTVGLATALAHRGLRHVRMPSTTLSQDDSGVGIKNGINAFGKKNFLGTFAPPYAVINDFDLLQSLSTRDKRAGYAEAVKVALIRDAGFFEWLEREADKLVTFDSRTMELLISRCAKLHIEHIANSGDPFELRSARPLDFGHWSAHKLEHLSDYRLRHGEAVAIGLALDALYSNYAGLLDGVSTERVLTLLARLGFDLFVDELQGVDSSGRLAILQGLEEFRQHLGGNLNVTLLKGIGRGTTVHRMKKSFILKAIQELRQRQNRASTR